MTAPYVAKYDARFGIGIRRNVINIVKDQGEAAFAFAEETHGVELLRYVEWNRSLHKQVHTPCFTIYRRPTGKIDDNSGSYIESVPRFGVIATIEAATEDEAEDLCEIYVQINDSIIRSAASDDLFKDLPVAVQTVDIVDHIYYPNVPLGTRYRQAVEAVLEIRLLEA